MNMRQLGRTGLRVSEICFGTMTFGGEGIYQAIGTTAQAEADRLVGACHDAGINFFDTADTYSMGRAEEILGRALGARRKEVVVATRSRPGKRCCARSTIWSARVKSATSAPRIWPPGTS